MLAPPPDPAAAERPADEGPTPMIPRYSRPAMAAIFEPENRFRIWLEIEALACEAHLRGEGILVRKTANYGLAEALRITVGLEADCERVLAAIRGRQAAGAA